MLLVKVIRKGPWEIVGLPRWVQWRRESISSENRDRERQEKVSCPVFLEYLVHLGKLGKVRPYWRAGTRLVIDSLQHPAKGKGSHSGVSKKPF